jgi:hypothetical protein
MTLTARYDGGLKSGYAADAASGRPPLAPIPVGAGASVRYRFVVGIFEQSADAARAANGPPVDGCDVLLVLGSAPGEAEAVPDGGRMIVHRLDTSDALAVKLAAALAGVAPFTVLVSGSWNPCREATSPPGPLQRLFQSLVHHLAAGATVAIVHVADSERQLQVSRALLEAKCDVLLTHDVVQAAGRAPATNAGECCESCTSETCSRIDPHRSGARHSKE